MPDAATTRDADNLVEMTDAEEAAFESALRDPLLINTHQQAIEYLDILDREIASIEASLEAARVEAAIAPLPPHRQDWVKRAAYACSIKKNQRHRIQQRDKEIRGTKGPAQTPPKDRDVGVAKQNRLMAEAEARREAARAETARQHRLTLEANDLRSWRRQFIEVAKLTLPAEQYKSMVDEAKRRATTIVQAIAAMQDDGVSNEQ